VSVEGARNDYGVVLTRNGDEVVVDTETTRELRTEQRSRRTEDAPFFDRGPGYARLAGGGSAADVDYVR